MWMMVRRLMVTSTCATLPEHEPQHEQTHHLHHYIQTERHQKGHQQHHHHERHPVAAKCGTGKRQGCSEQLSSSSSSRPRDICQPPQSPSVELEAARAHEIGARRRLALVRHSHAGHPIASAPGARKTQPSRRDPAWHSPKLVFLDMSIEALASSRMTPLKELRQPYEITRN